MNEMINERINKLYKVFRVTTGLRITLPKQLPWNDGDHVEYTIVDSDTVTMKRVFKSNSNSEVPMVN